MAIYRPSIDGGQQTGRPAVMPRSLHRPSVDDGGNQTCSPVANPRPNFHRQMTTRTLKHTESLMSSTTSFIQQNRYMRALNRLRLLCGGVVNHPQVQILVIYLIVINAAMMGVATYDFVTENPVVNSAFNKTDLVFLIVFTIELAMQFIFRGYTLFKNGWLVFDFVIILVSWVAAPLQVIRSFRIFRALRVITRVKTMRNLVQALFSILPRLGAITAMLLLIFYIFGVLFTELFGELELSGEYFSRLDYSLLTLFVMMTMEWSDIARECMAQIWWAWMPFISFIMITGFIVFNLIIAVVCDAVAVIENKEDLHPDSLELIEHESGKDGDRLIEDTQNPDGSTIEEDVVEDLADRITSALNNQKAMLATLEALINSSMVLIQPVAEGSCPRFAKNEMLGDSQEEESDK